MSKTKKKEMIRTCFKCKKEFVPNENFNFIGYCPDCNPEILLKRKNLENKKIELLIALLEKPSLIYPIIKEDKVVEALIDNMGRDVISKELIKRGKSIGMIPRYL